MKPMMREYQGLSFFERFLSRHAGFFVCWVFDTRILSHVSEYRTTKFIWGALRILDLQALCRLKRPLTWLTKQATVVISINTDIIFISLSNQCGTRRGHRSCCPKFYFLHEPQPIGTIKCVVPNGYQSPRWFIFYCFSKSAGPSIRIQIFGTLRALQILCFSFITCFMPSNLDILIQHYFRNVGKVHPQSHCYHHIYVAQYNANKLSPIGVGFIFAHHHYKFWNMYFKFLPPFTACRPYL